MKIKRILALFFTFLFCLLSCVSCTSKKAQGQLIVGTSTALSGDFFSGFGDNGADLNIIELIHGNSTIVYQKESASYGINPTVVKKVETTVNDDTSKTYSFTLANDLVWNDSTPISAKDYVFSILLYTSQEFSSIDGDTSQYIDFVGYEDCLTGKPFSGVKMPDDTHFSVTIKAEKLPFYYDFAMVAITPIPMHILAPNASIESSDAGVQIAGEFSAEILQKTIADTETGYRYNPQVTCGAYQLETFDRGTKQAVLIINPSFSGDYNNQKPSIEKIILKQVKYSTQIDELASGSVDLIQGCSGADGINPGLTLVEEGKANFIAYPRAGYGQITFICDYGPTQFVKVRQAIAHLLDVPEFARQYSGGYAEVVYGMYGAAQWMYQDNKKQIEEEFNTYAFDLTKAEQLLVEDGWTWNKDGIEYIKGTDTLRYKKVDGDLMPLEIYWCNSPDNPVSDLLSQILPTNMQEVGMKLVSETLELPVLLDYYYRTAPEIKFHMYNLATGFLPVFDPEPFYRLDDASVGYPNSNCLKDEKLYALAVALKQTESGDKEAYSEKWFAFQKYWNEILPNIPLYSDEYHDFFNLKLKNYDVDAFWTWTDAILYASVEK